MTCDEAYVRLNDLVDGVLSEEEAAAVEGHVEGCAVCEGAYRELLALEGLLNEAPRPVFSEERMQALLTSMKPLTSTRAPVVRTKWVLPAALSLGVFLALGFAVGLLWAVLLAEKVQSQGEGDPAPITSE